ncbi:hypothetical protein TNCV_4333921 [Trichonephila clavipes]|nr:hypothetical protein TNCV_4333921 [Trichonephila clavipes]
MPFGLCNAPATYERMMDNLLRHFKWTMCLCYRTPTELLERTLLLCERPWVRTPAPPPNLSRSSKEVHSSIKQTIRFILTLGDRYNTGLRTSPTGDELCFYTLRRIFEKYPVCTLKNDLDSSRT